MQNYHCFPIRYGVFTATVVYSIHAGGLTQVTLITQAISIGLYYFLKNATKKALFPFPEIFS